MTCGTCKGFTKAQIMIGYYLCGVNSTKDVEYIVKPTAKCCDNYKQKNTKKGKDDEQRKQ